MQGSTVSGSVMCFDLGLARTGVAIGNTLIRSAQPVGVIKAQTNDARWRRIDEYCKEWQPDFFVVGLPKLADGTLSDWGKRCERFARQLEGRYHKRVYLVDERYSSVDVEDAEVGYIDDLAACVILEQFFAEL